MFEYIRKIAEHSPRETRPDLVVFIRGRDKPINFAVENKNPLGSIWLIDDTYKRPLLIQMGRLPGAEDPIETAAVLIDEITMVLPVSVAAKEYRDAQKKQQESDKPTLSSVPGVVRPRPTT